MHISNSQILLHRSIDFFLKTGKKIVLNKGVYTDKELNSLIGMELKSQMHFVTSPEHFTRFEPQSPQHKKLKNDTITSLTLAITDQNNDIITDRPDIIVVLHIR